MRISSKLSNLLVLILKLTYEFDRLQDYISMYDILTQAIPIHKGYAT